MGCLTAATLFPMDFKSCAIFRVVWLFPHPVLTAQIEMTGLVLFIIVAFAPSSVKLAPQAITFDA